MEKEKVVSLTKYLGTLTDRLSAPIPEKHKDRPKEYLEYLTREIARTKETLTQGKEG